MGRRERDGDAASGRAEGVVDGGETGAEDGVFGSIVVFAGDRLSSPFRPNTFLKNP
jgi:hypothetical protein